MFTLSRNLVLAEPLPHVHIIDVHPDIEKYHDPTILAKVLAVGRGVSDVNPGDFILLGRFSGMEIDWERKRLYVCREDEIFATVDGQDVVQH